LIAIIASTYQLSEAPAIWYDEGFYSQMAMNFGEVGKQVLQVAPNEFVSSAYVTVGYPLTLPIALSYKLFGVGVLQGRAVMAIFILGFVVATYFLTRRLFGNWTATLSVLLLATFPMLYGNGKPVLGEVPGLFFFTLTLIALYDLEKNEYRDWRRYALVGLLAGLTAATKMFFALFLIALAITLVLRIRKLPLNWPGVAMGTIATLIPLGLWAYVQFGADASLSSILSYYSNPYAVANLPLHMLENARRFVTESTPLYTLIMMLMWACALFIRRKEKISVVETAAFTFSILVILSYLRLEGWYRYLFPATIVSLLFFSASSITVYNYFSRFIPFTPRSRFALVPYVFVALLSLAQLYQTAHSSYVAQYYHSTRTRDVTTALATIDKQSTIFIYNSPETVILLPTRNYYQYLSPLPNVHIGESKLNVLKNGEADLALTDTETYKKEPGLFSRYIKSHEFDRYILLKKQ
jgi:4-amino-4-deoxy-L-arabinose transferase-like glycosyltransferase